MKTTVNESGRTQWHFSKAELQALLVFMSTDETRHTLCCLAFDQENGRVWATDGHRGAILTGMRYGQTAAVQRPVEAMRRSDVEAIVKNANMRDEILILGPGAASGFFQESGLDISVMADKPNNLPVVYPAVWPAKAAEGVVAGFNGGYIADLSMITRACPPTVVKKHKGTDKIYPGLEIQPPIDPLSPMLVHVHCPANASKWSAVVMPMRL